MEKLVIEIELTKEELDLFNEFIENGCIDREKYMKKYILQAIERYKHFKSVNRQIEFAQNHFSSSK